MKTVIRHKDDLKGGHEESKELTGILNLVKLFGEGNRRSSPLGVCSAHLEPRQIGSGPRGHP